MAPGNAVRPRDGDDGGPKSLSIVPERAHQIGWVLAHLDDVASDMSVFHRVDDITELDGPTLFRLVWRLPAYSGVVRALVAEQQETSVQPMPYTPTAGSAGGRRWNPGTKTTLQTDPDVAGLFSFGSFT